MQSPPTTRTTTNFGSTKSSIHESLLTLKRTRPHASSSWSLRSARSATTRMCNSRRSRSKRLASTRANRHSAQPSASSASSARRPPASRALTLSGGPRVAGQEGCGRCSPPSRSPASQTAIPSSSSGSMRSWACRPFVCTPPTSMATRAPTRTASVSGCATRTYGLLIRPNTMRRAASSSLHQRPPACSRPARRNSSALSFVPRNIV
mmetsp:Transcript_3781/g.11687  ORF Transcript_3781/g.11687 Transcript_3781/m.11687 type:complete len:207 (+) Transcript_3781:907-1527(+)